MIDLRDAAADAASVIRALQLQPHPEGGHYREAWRDAPAEGGRGAGTAILFLLRAGERSAWHRVDAAELWLWQAGAPLTLRVAPQTTLRLGPDLRAGDKLQGLVPAHQWQAAESLGPWTLCTCVVAPAFDFAGFELATGAIPFAAG
ncbi:MAG TPA: cupin domain-containing protein [Acetobacteraceae bacterium]|nr:cupin domain-containing protein [Acetobacteraceae bacterium]